MNSIIALTFSSLTTMALADMIKILEQMGTMAKANNVTVGGLQSLRKSGPEDRFVDPILTYMDPILNYGCWCHFGADWIHAGGKVRDDIDLRCKQLIQGYRCARMDARAQNKDCDAGNINYSALKNSGLSFVIFGDFWIVFCQTHCKLRTTSFSDKIFTPIAPRRMLAMTAPLTLVSSKAPSLYTF